LSLKVSFFRLSRSVHLSHPVAEVASYMNTDDTLACPPSAGKPQAGI
jgi:hypothetical protein